jgi:integrase
MVRRVKMSPAWLQAVKAEAKDVEWKDAKTPGLSLRMTKKGVATWYVRYVFEGRPRRFKLGLLKDVGLSDARTAAGKARGAASSQGKDPQLEKQKKSIGDTVERAVDSWLADKRGPARWKGGSDGGTARSYLPHIRAFKREYGSYRLAAITPKDCERFISAPQSPATRNRRLQALRFLFEWAKRKTLIEADPTAGLDKEREEERTRTLTDPELAALIRGFDVTRYGRAVRLLVLTGLRRDEVLGARWDWLDSKAKVLTIPPDAEKTGRSRGSSRRVPLSEAAVKLFTDQREALLAEGLRWSPWCFPTGTGERPHADALKPILYRLRGLRSNGQPASNDKRAKKREASIPEDVSIHDIRRTVGDALLNRMKAQPWVVDHVVLGHVRPKLLRTYMPTLPLDEAREALAKWSEAVDVILTKTPKEMSKP